MTHESEDRFGGPAKLAGQNRIRLVAIGFSIAFLAISLQLANLTIYKGMGVEDDVLAEHQPRMPRPPQPLYGSTAPDHHVRTLELRDQRR